jgi:proteic killer suppression protein
MIIRFKNIYLEAPATDNIKGKPRYNIDVINRFKKTLKILEFMPTIKSLWKLNGLSFEALSGNRKGYFSVRVDLHHRLIFEIEEDILAVTEIIIINELTNHYQQNYGTR